MSVLECRKQEGAVFQLQRARRSKRMPHSYIFSGPEGVGKFLLACQWGKLLLCSEPVERKYPRTTTSALALEELDDCCDQCNDCKLVQAGNHPDLHIITRDLVRYTKDYRKAQLKNLSIKVIRDFVIKAAGLVPSHGRARVFIINEAHTMSTEAQNALLKTLEEPPMNTFILLITSQDDMLLPTVRSRCQSVRFGPLPNDFIYEELIGRGVPTEQGGFWADFCDGRLGVALELSKTNLYQKRLELLGQLGNLSYHSALDLAQWLVEQAKEWSQVYAKEHPETTPNEAMRRGQSYFLQMLAHTFSMTLRDSAVCTSETSASDPAISRLAQKYSAWACSRAVRATNRTERLIQANVNPSLLFENLILEYMIHADT